MQELFGKKNKKRICVQDRKGKRITNGTLRGRKGSGK
jgi:hypothetical protein